jgi:hypothetical protein
MEKSMTATPDSLVRSYSITSSARRQHAITSGVGNPAPVSLNQAVEDNPPLGQIPVNKRAQT